MANTLGIIGDAGNTYADPGIYYDKRFLDRLSPQLSMDKLGDKRPLPLHSGTLIKWHRLNKLVVSTTPLEENDSDTEQDVSVSEFTAQPLTYGKWVKVSSELNLKAVNPIVEEIMDELADQAALGYDTIARDVIHANVTDQFAGGADSEINTSAVMTASELRKAVWQLRHNKARGYEGNLYKALISDTAEFDLFSEDETGSVIDVMKQTKPEILMAGEAGQLYGCRIVMTQNASEGVGVGTAVTYRNFVFAKGAFGITELAGQGVKTIRQAPGSVADPLEMYSTLGWKFMMTAKVLDANRAVEIYATSAATPA